MGLSPSKHPGSFYFRALPNDEYLQDMRTGYSPEGEVQYPMTLPAPFCSDIFLLSNLQPQTLKDLRETPGLTEKQGTVLGEY